MWPHLSNHSPNSDNRYVHMYTCIWLIIPHFFINNHGNLLELEGLSDNEHTHDYLPRPMYMAKLKTSLYT